MSTPTIGKLGCDTAATEIPTGRDRATPRQSHNLTAPTDALQWRSTAPEIDVRDQSWDRAPLRTHGPRTLARRAA